MGRLARRMGRSVRAQATSGVHGTPPSYSHHRRQNRENSENRHGRKRRPKAGGQTCRPSVGAGLEQAGWFCQGPVHIFYWMPASQEAVREVLDLCRQAAEANRSCAVRRGNVVSLSPDNAEDVMIVADLHGNRLNFEKLLR